MRGNNKPVPANIGDYINQKPVAFRPLLLQLAGIIKNVCPQATESISYQIPCFKYLYMLVGIGVNKNSCSFYTMSPGLIKQMKDELTGLKISGATIHFALDAPLPIALIEKIVKARIKQNESLAISKSKN